MRFLIITMGPGETSQGLSFGKYILSQNHEVDFGLILKENLKFLDDSIAHRKILDSPKKVYREIESGDYDVVVFCNSKMFRDDKNFQLTAPKGTTYYCSIDSNWLFGQSETFTYIKWLDNIFVNLPKRVFDYGLIENGGNYKIDSDAINKIVVVGLIPSYQKLTFAKRQEIRRNLGVTSDQKLIFSYIGSGISYRKYLESKLSKIADTLLRNYDGGIKVVNISNTSKNDLFLDIAENIDSKYFYELLACSDLVFQHQGLGTLEQAISAGVPVITNVDDVKENSTHSTSWEVKPFEKAGLCSMHYYNDSIQSIIKSIEGLVTEGNSRQMMIDAQSKYYSKGERNMLEQIELSINKKG